jgi:hypothetical protein
VTEAQMRELAAATFTAAWERAQPAVPLVLEDEIAASSDAKALFAVQVTASDQMTQGPRGTRRVRRRVWLSVKLWTPAGQGSARLAALADSARALLEMIDMPSPIAGDDPITTLAADAGVPPYTDGHWRMQVVRVPGWYCETR